MNLPRAGRTHSGRRGAAPAYQVLRVNKLKDSKASYHTVLTAPPWRTSSQRAPTATAFRKAAEGCIPCWRLGLAGHRVAGYKEARFPKSLVQTTICLLLQTLRLDPEAEAKADISVAT